MTTFTLKLGTLYAAYSPELGVVSYGACLEEAINRLAEQFPTAMTGEAADDNLTHP